MDKKTKRLLAIAMAALLVFCVLLPAFAEGEDQKKENEGEEPWRGFLRILGAIASYAFVFGVIIIGVGFFIARLKTGRRGY